MPKQATTRKLSEAELHRELRLADRIIEHAIESMSIDSRVKLVYDLCQISLTNPSDPLGNKSRQQALNRTHRLPSLLFLIVPTAFSLVLGVLAMIYFS